MVMVVVLDVEVLSLVGVGVVMVVVSVKKSCENCQKAKAERVFCGAYYCYSCLFDYVNDELRAEVIELWIEQNTDCWEERE